MSGAWTKGPWRVVKDSRHVVDVLAGNRDVVSVYGGGVGLEYRDANAHLIAAAPDLYAALDGLLAAYSEPDQQICCNGHECGCRGASVRDLAEHHARAALAKARGEA
jgi:hypothetical protein